VTLGIGVPLSGPYSATGENITNSIKLAGKHAVEEGLVEEVNYIQRDTKTDPQTARQITQEMISEGADFVEGYVVDAGTFAASQIADQENVIMLGQTANLRTDIEVCRKNLFPVTLSVPGYTEAGLGYALREGVAESVYQISSDFTWPQDMVKYANEKYLPEMGVENKGNTFVPLGNSDYSSALSEAKNSGADLVVMNAFGADVVKLLNQAKEFGFLDEGIGLATPIVTESLVEAVDPEVRAYDKMFFGVQFYHGLETSAAQEFVSAYRNEYDKRPGLESIHYAGFRTLLEAVNAAGTTNTDDVREELKGRSFSPQLWGTGEKFRTCDKRNTLPAMTAKGRPESEVDEKGLFEIVNINSNPDQILLPCDQTACAGEAPDWY